MPLFPIAIISIPVLFRWIFFLRQSGTVDVRQLSALALARTYIHTSGNSSITIGLWKMRHVSGDRKRSVPAQFGHKTNKCIFEFEPIDFRAPLGVNRRKRKMGPAPGFGFTAATAAIDKCWFYLLCARSFQSGNDLDLLLYPLV